MLVCGTWLSYAEASVDPFLGALLAKPSKASKPAPPSQSVTFIHALASVGPLEYLSMATVSLKDSNGKIISRGKTNIRGSVVFYLTQDKLHNLPLKLIATGGKIIGQTGDQYNGPQFNGHLRAQISDVKQGKHNKVWMDMLSTSASVMQSKDLSYDAATSEIRAALKIGKGFPVKGLRYQNNHVGWTELQTAYKKNGGYDRYIQRLVDRIKKKEQITELTPTRYTSPAKKTINTMAEVINNAINPTDQPTFLTTAQAEDSSSTTTATSSQFPQCTVPLGNTSSATSSVLSTDIISDFGVLGMQILLQTAGNFVSTAASGVPTEIDEIGMLLVGGATGSTTASQLAAVEQQLVCVSAQLNYLSEQVDTVALQADLISSQSCADAVTQDYDTYESLVYNAQPYGSTAPIGITLTSSCYPNQTSGSASSCPLNSTNSILTGALLDWAPTADLYNGTCAGPIGVNSLLFETQASGSTTLSAWQQINNNQQAKYGWYTALQVQQLQQFLSYWSTIEYNLFTLANEFDNWCTNSSSYYYDTTNGTCPQSNNLCSWTCPENRNDVSSSVKSAINSYVGAIQQMAGNVSGTSLCATGTTSTSNNFCAAQSNIVNAYPPDLYSDEIGIWSTVNGGAGLAISAYPAGLAMSLGQMGLGQLGLNPYYLGQPLITPDPGSWPASNATGPSYTQFNSQGINPSGQPSAIQQFSNPQALKTLQPTSLQVSSLQMPQLTPGTTSANGDNWANAWSFFVSSIQQQPPNSGTPFPIASEWTNLVANNNTSNGTGFFTADNVGEFSNAAQGNQPTCNNYTTPATNYTYNFNTTIGTYSWQFQNCGSGAGPVNTAPVFGVLLGRTWWSAYSGSNAPISYMPPQPCVPNSTASACNVPAPTLTNLSISNSNGAASIQLSFTPASVSSGGIPIMQYLATCTSTNSSTPITITGSTTTPSVTSLILQGESGSGGYYYSCTMVALNGLRISSPSSNALTNAPSVPQAPTLISGSYRTQSNAANIKLTYVAPTFTGNSPITSYNAVCAGGPYRVSGTTSSSSTISMVGGSGTATPGSYSCTVTATNSLGTSQSSNSISILNQPY